jgi:hypothetical protein
MEFAKIEIKSASYAIDEVKSTTHFESFVDSYNAGKMQLLKFFSDRSKDKLVDPNLFRMVFNYASSAEDIYCIKLKEMKDYIVSDGKDTMYKYLSWNERLVKHKKRKQRVRRIKSETFLKFDEYNGIESTDEEWENFADDKTILREVLSLYDWKLVWYNPTYKCNRTIDTERDITEFEYQDLDTDSTIWVNYLNPVIKGMSDEEFDNYVNSLDAKKN